MVLILVSSDYSSTQVSVYANIRISVSLKIEISKHLDLCVFEDLCIRIPVFLGIEVCKYWKIHYDIQVCGNIHKYV